MDAPYLDPFIETLGREALAQIQLKKFQLMLEPIMATNAYYRKKLAAAGVTRAADVRTLDDYRRLPFTTKEELSADQAAHPPYGTNLTFPVDRYTHIHQTAGTKSEPMRWLDTEESWRWWASCWATVYRAAGVGSGDRIFFAFSFGPFIGFWSAYAGAQRIGALAIPGGGMSSHQRVKAIAIDEVSVLVCTPTYALHLAEVALDDGLDLVDSSVRVTIHAGEPGASLPGTKKRIETAWGARCYDHAGSTEVGAWGFECQAQAGVHMNEGEFICEVVDPATGKPAPEGELVITNLGRVGMPVVRYRTGDRVKLASSECPCGRTFHRAEGGVAGRIDEVFLVRGVAVFPSAIEDIVRQFPEAGEFVADIHRRGQLDEMELRLEVSGAEPESVVAAVARGLHNGLGLRVVVRPVPFGTLPRFTVAARRFSDHREPREAR